MGAPQLAARSTNNSKRKGTLSSFIEESHPSEKAGITAQGAKKV
jgi:hypothetical protein